MAIAPTFEYARPRNLEEALRLKDQYRERALVLAGGTDLIANLREDMIHPELLIDIKDIPGLDKIVIEAGTLKLGPLVTFTQLIEFGPLGKSFPMLLDASRTVASVGIRNRATLVGNICSAVPSLDSAPPLLCHEAVVHCLSLEGERHIRIDDWFTGPRKTALKPDEIVTGITLQPVFHSGSGIYLKLGRYGGEDLAQAGWGILIDGANHYRVAHCALGPVPARASKIEALLDGNQLNEALIQQAMDLVPEEISPITDIRSSKEYRTHISKVILKRGLLAARERLAGKDIDPRTLLGGI
ncbi:MAG TPA: xanthine dehydrogenase family protein subunit M [Candidatus Cloacimonadota bacterium]|nr:xanthine dehydrogenase family protein subunit M [Candidatus Cloacimonadota bacterium]